MKNVRRMHAGQTGLLYPTKKEGLKTVHIRRKGSGTARRRSSFAAAAALAMSGHAMAFEADTGNADIQLRWDNTLRYNVATRVESRNRKIGNTAVADEGDYSFDNGDLVANRLDLLRSEERRVGKECR